MIGWYRPPRICPPSSNLKMTRRNSFMSTMMVGFLPFSLKFYEVCIRIQFVTTTKKYTLTAAIFQSLLEYEFLRKCFVHFFLWMFLIHGFPFCKFQSIYRLSIIIFFNYMENSNYVFNSKLAFQHNTIQMRWHKMWSRLKFFIHSKIAHASETQRDRDRDRDREWEKEDDIKIRLASLHVTQWNVWHGCINV